MCCALFYLCTTALAVGYGPKQYRLNEELYGAVAIAFIIELTVRNLRARMRALLKRRDT